MKTLTVILLFAASLTSVHACVEDPETQILRSPDAFAEQADIVFFGTLAQLYDDKPSYQTAVFEVEHVFKGPRAGSIVVLNSLSSSCSRPLQAIGQRFYVFAYIDEDAGEYRIGHRGGFVSEGAAKQSSFNPAADL